MNLSFITDADLIQRVSINAGAAWIISFVALLVYEYIYCRYYYEQEVPVPMGVCGILASITRLVSSIWLGGIIALHLAEGHIGATVASRRPIFYAGMVLGAWVTAMALQLVKNAVRSALGRPTEPLRFMNHSVPRRRRRAGR